MKKFLPIFLLLPFTACQAAPKTILLTPDQIENRNSKIENSLQPGDTLLLPNGTYNDTTLTFPNSGTPQHPITLRAQTPGKVIFTGKSTITLTGNYQILDGILIQNGGGPENQNPPTDGIAIKGDHCQLTNSAMIGGTYKFLVHLYGIQDHMDHCFLAGKSSGEPTFQIEAPPEQPDRDLVDFNHFGYRFPLGRNGGETIRVGYSWQSMNPSYTLVQHNLFDRCSGEIEIISSKSCDNIYRDNTFDSCGGMLTLRHGNRDSVTGNFFLAHHVKGSGGIRVIGEDHSLTNNYIEGVEMGAFWITAGVPDSQLKEYFTAKRALISHNTIVDCNGPAFDVDAGMGGAKRSLFPEDIAITDNLLVIPQNGYIEKGVESKTYTWQNNLTDVTKQEFNHPGISYIDPKMQRAKDGLLYSAAAGKTGYQQSTNPAYHPITAAQVGPNWLPLKDREPPATSQ